MESETGEPAQAGFVMLAEGFSLAAYVHVGKSKRRGRGSRGQLPRIPRETRRINKAGIQIPCQSLTPIFKILRLGVYLISMLF